MKIAIDQSPLVDSEKISHRVRGVGYYIKNLKSSLQSLSLHDEFVFFNNRSEIPRDSSIIHYPYFEPFFISLPLEGIQKTVVTIHDLTPLVFPDKFPVGLRGKIRWNVQKHILQKTARIITDSKASKKDIIRFTGISEEKVDVVYLASSQEFRPIAKNRLKVVKDRYSLPETFILYVGDVTWNKNLPRLLQAAKKVGIPIVLVGKALTTSTFDRNNPWNRDLSLVFDIAKSDAHIIRLGFVPDDDLPSLYNLATIFTMPSLYEGFGLPLLEAMGCGAPVLTSNKGSIPEVVDDAAHIVDPYNVDDIARGISELLKNTKERELLRERGFKQVGKFSWKKTAEQTVGVYKNAAVA